MKKIYFIILFIFFLLANLYSGVIYQLDFSSNYIWRGWDLNPNKKAVIQPSLTLESICDSGFSLNLWTSLSFENSEVDEIDFTLSYDFKMSDKINLSVGFINYGWYLADNFIFEDNTSQEVYATVGFPEVFLSPSISIYYDITSGNGLYATGSISQNIRLSSGFNMELSASLGYNGGQWLKAWEKKGLSDLNLSASFPFTYKKINFAASLHYTKVLLDAIGKKDYLYFGASISF